MNENLNRLTKAELIKKLEENTIKKEPEEKAEKPFDLKDTIYDRAKDFPEYEEHKRKQAEKTRKFRETMVNFKG